MRENLFTWMRDLNHAYKSWRYHRDAKTLPPVQERYRLYKAVFFVGEARELLASRSFGRYMPPDQRDELARRLAEVSDWIRNY